MKRFCVCFKAGDSRAYLYNNAIKERGNEIQISEAWVTWSWHFFHYTTGKAEKVGLEEVTGRAQSPLLSAFALSGKRRGENFTQEREGRSLKVFKRCKMVIQEGKGKCNVIRQCCMNNLISVVLNLKWVVGVFLLKSLAVQVWDHWRECQGFHNMEFGQVITPEELRLIMDKEF